MDSHYKEFIVSNGYIYPQKAEDLKIYTGYTKVRITWTRAKDPSVVKARVYWNNYTDSLDVAIPQDKDIVSVDVENLKENTYTFYIRTFDAAGNVSIPAEITGKVYGEPYLASLANRSAKYILFDPDSNKLTIDWVGKAQDEVECVLEYMNMQDIVIKQSIPLTEFTTVIEEFKSGLKINSAFLPTASIDTFRIAPSTPKITMPVLDHQVITGVNTGAGGSAQCTITNHGDYLELVVTNNDPYVYTNALEENIGLTSYYKVYFHVEYQADRRITNAQLFFGKPNAAGGVSTTESLVFENTGLNAANESQWAIFQFDCATAIGTHAWGDVGHRFRYDFIGNGAGGSNNGTTLYIRKMWFEIYKLLEVDL
jgi:hypothetical protein